MRRMVCGLLWVLLGGCASENSFHVSEDSSATVAGSRRLIGEQRYTFVIERIDGRGVGGYYGPFGTTKAAWDEKFRIPVGDRSVGVQMRYAPRGGIGQYQPMFALDFELKFNAKIGQSYVPNGEVVDGREQMWMEDSNGKRVSDVAIPFERRQVF